MGVEPDAPESMAHKIQVKDLDKKYASVSRQVKVEFMSVTSILVVENETTISEQF